MAEEIKYTIRVNTTGVDKATNALGKLGNATKNAVEKSSGKLDALSDKFGSMPGAIGNVASSMGGLGKSMMALVANPLGAVLAGLVAIFFGLREALKQTEEGLDAMESLTSSLTAVFRPLVEVVGKFAAFLVGGLAKGLEAITSLFTDSAKQGASLAKVMQDLEDEELALNEARAKQNQSLAETRELLSDANATIEERRKALEKVSKSETDLAAKEVKFAKQKLYAAKEDMRLHGESEERKKAISAAIVEVANAETDLAAKRRLFNKEAKKLDKEEEERKKEQAKAEQERQKEIAEKAKEYSKARRDAADKIREAENKNILASIKDEELKAKKQAELDYQATKREIARSEFNKKEKARLLQEAEKSYQIELTKIAESGDAKRLENEKKAIEELKSFKEKAYSDEQAFIDLQYQKKQLEIQRTISDETQLNEALLNLERDRLNNQLQAQKDAGKDTTALELQIAQNYKAINKFKQDSDKATADNKKKLQDEAVAATSQALGSIVSLVGAESKWGKALAVTQAIIDTYSGASKALAQGGIVGPIAAAGVIASGLANIRSITSTKLPEPPSGMSGGGYSEPSVTQPPSFGPSVGIIGGQLNNSTQLAQAFGGIMQKPIRAYAVGQDMTSQQSLDRHINQNATLGG